MDTDLRTLLENSQKTKALPPDAIPELELYIDQIIALMQKYLGEEGEKEPLTRTMIHNYSKAGLIAPVKGKKYNKDQILQMLSVYTLKNTLTIAQVRRVLCAMSEESIPQGSMADAFAEQINWRDSLNAQVTDTFLELAKQYDMSADSPENAFRMLLLLTDITDMLSSFASAISMTYFPDPPKKK